MSELFWAAIGLMGELFLGFRVNEKGRKRIACEGFLGGDKKKNKKTKKTKKRYLERKTEEVGEGFSIPDEMKLKRGVAAHVCFQ